MLLTVEYGTVYDGAGIGSCGPNYKGVLPLYLLFFFLIRGSYHMYFGCLNKPLYVLQSIIIMTNIFLVTAGTFL